MDELWRLVTCPLCKAQPLDWCFNRTSRGNEGRMAYVHYERRAEWRRQGCPQPEVDRGV